MPDVGLKRTQSRFLSKDRRRTWKLEEVFEKLLWSSRFFVLLAVVSSLAASLCLFLLGTFDVVKVFVNMVSYVLGFNERFDLHGDVFIAIIGSLNTFLVAIILLLFSLGAYQLFLRPLEAAEKPGASGLFLFDSLDGLRDRIFVLVLLSLTVKFFQIVLIMKVGSWLDLLILAGAVGLLAGAMVLMHWGKRLTREEE